MRGHQKDVTRGSDVPQEQAEPQEPPEGRIMFMVVPPGSDRTQNTKEENDMNERTKPKGFGIAATVLLAALLIAAVIVPAVAATPERSMEEWMKDHTVNVESTTIYRYDQGYLEIQEIYTGEDIEKRFGVDNLTRSRKIPVEARTVGMKDGEERVFVTEKSVVITTANDPYQWWDSYDYPQWTYSESDGRYILEDPINLAWENTDKDTVKSEILEEDGWVDIWWPFEYDQYVSDPNDGWIKGDGVADDWFGIWGRDHTRLWQMSDGDVVANAHHDSAVPHHADQYEPAEDLVAGFYDGGGWTVYADNYWLSNEYTNEHGAYNDGWATRIYET